VRIKDKNGNEATGPVSRTVYAMSVDVFGKRIEFARYSSKAGRTRAGDWVVASGIRVIGHQPAMF
jgi:hypothetical protein